MRNHGSEFVVFNLLSKHLLDHLTRPLRCDSNIVLPIQIPVARMAVDASCVEC